jgi:hypothetical protein
VQFVVRVVLRRGMDRQTTNMNQTYCPHRIPFTQLSVRGHGLRLAVREKFVSETCNSRCVNMSGVI